MKTSMTTPAGLRPRAGRRLSQTGAGWQRRRLQLAAVIGLLAGAADSRGADEPAFGLLSSDPYLRMATNASGITLKVIATNLWPAALETRADDLCFRTALDKVEYRIGEPVHLFVFFHACSETGLAMPKASNWEMLRVTIVDHRGQPVALTPAGEWLASRGAPDGWGRRSFLPGTIKVAHLNLTDLAVLREPGEYVVVPKAVFFSGPWVPGMPAEAELPPLRFRLSAATFDTPVSRFPNPLLVEHQRFLDRQAGREEPPRPEPSAVEAEMAAMVEPERRAVREALERDMAAERARLQAAAAQPAPATTSQFRARAEAEPAPDVAPGAAGTARTGMKLAVMGVLAAGLMGVWWFLRRSSTK